MTRDEREIQREIGQVRRELGDTVEALAYKANLPARARDRGAELTEQIRQVPPQRWAVVGGALAGVLALILVLRSVRSR